MSEQQAGDSAKNGSAANENVVHKLVLDRLYHEDFLLTQRTYNFLTFNVFLAGVLALNYGASQAMLPGLAYLLSAVGVLWGFFHVAFGRRTERAIAFWRQYLRLLERAIDVPVDHLLFQFYEDGSVTTPWGIIASDRPVRRAMYKTFPWSLIPSTNAVIGVVAPWAVATLWLVAFVLPLREHLCAIGIALVIFAGVTTFAFWWPVPALPKADM